jgi:ATP-dependent helicase HrpA
VLVREKLNLFGLELLTRRVPYSRVDARKATDIFIREALVPGVVHTRHGFLEQNTSLCQKLETWQSRTSSASAAGVNIERSACEFYTERLEDVSSLHDLNRFLKDNPEDYLVMAEQDLLGASSAKFDEQAFPDALEFDGEVLGLKYAYRPGQDEDGITLSVPYKLVQAIDPEVLEWLVPGVLQQKITALLRDLPKSIRKQLVPIPDRAKEIATVLKPTHPTFLESLADHIYQRYRVPIQSGDWNTEELPAHLRMRIEVRGNDDKQFASGRDLHVLNRRLDQHDKPGELDAWKKVAATWEREGITSWDFGDLPERIEVTQIGGVPLYGWPSLDRNEHVISLRLCKSRVEAVARSLGGFSGLCALTLGEDLIWLQRELKDLDQFKSLYPGTPLELREQAYANLERYLFHRENILPLRQNDFDAALGQARTMMNNLAPHFISLIGSLLKTREDILLSGLNYKELSADLGRLLPIDFLSQVPYEQLNHLHRYLKTIRLRAERAKTDPRKDAQKVELIAVYQTQFDELAASDSSPERKILVGELRWMLEEYRVSVFAQELGTAQPISPKRMDKKIEEIKRVR